MSGQPQVPFSLAMSSVSGSAPFVALVFDDGAAVSLHSVRALATELGLVVPQGTVFDLVEDWERAFPALCVLVNALAYSKTAQGHRGNFVAEDLLTMERLLPEARQTFRIGDGPVRALPASVQVGASASVLLDDAMKEAQPNLCLGAVIGRMCRRVDATNARHAIAGWALATELVRTGENGLTRCSAPGSLILGPLFVPAPFAEGLFDGEALLALTGAPAQTRQVKGLAEGLEDQIAALSEYSLLLPGDVIVSGPSANPSLFAADQIDTIEAVAGGFGRQTVSLF
ncbi:fumarylacetoacetate hydrolase family protein [Bradyrhizobium sp. Leo121]|uniref:fumarylacetoacetate hydrolase family protein n=1 Tax=Bradyrhizobium sp. Leo121 TaxID=1571195 RepID=UPI001028926D|nr:fumarylacetoacetate hydrolase family protein [Bradyrhizobium sp. Leo121]RZN31445.1 hypothetical protein CWO90_16960 [Bradyrhizobium sp. Leo121]